MQSGEKLAAQAGTGAIYEGATLNFPLVVGGEKRPIYERRTDCHPASAGFALGRAVFYPPFTSSAITGMSPAGSVALFVIALQDRRSSGIVVGSRPALPILYQGCARMLTCPSL